MVSIQVLQEYYSAATRKLFIDPILARQKVEVFSRLHVVRFEKRDVIAAIDLHQSHRLSIWDALIVHAAHLGECEILYPEDMQHNSRIGGVIDA